MRWIRILRSTAFATITAGAAITALPERAVAQGYQIDCAILLCLSGGWPASVPCARARVEFIRRITPWPIEPPLQIWRCPMFINYESTDPMQQIYDIMAPVQPQQSFSTGDPLTTVIEADAPDLGDAIKPALAVGRRSGGAAMPEDFRLYLAQSVGTGADIDVSDIAFDFIRSIDVFHVQLNQHERRISHRCKRSANVRHGTYDETGQFTWEISNYTQIPEAFVGDEHYSVNCSDVLVRAVFVDWNDYEGTYGFEQVNY